MDNPDPKDSNQEAEQADAPNPKDAKAEPTKPVTIVLGEALLKKLKVIAVMKDTSISTVIEGYVAKLVKADIRKMLGKLET